ncbi:MAG: class I adenylate-forming enzyme family protein [Candidatus Alcyoniella australis]|nr:class I adenylate-forming enzyme family protein [Candidatus Alcyoniella australis]
MGEYPKRHGVPQLTLKDFETEYADRHLLHGVVAKWAAEKPEALAIINADTRVEVSWQRLDQSATALALKLIQMGFKKGDFFATSLPLLTEHIFLEYACFKIGVVFVPLDLRLKGPEVIRSLGLVKAKGYAFLGKTPHADFSELGKAVQANCPFVKHLVQFADPSETIEGVLSIHDLGADAKRLGMEALADPSSSKLLADYMQMTNAVSEDDGCLVIFTTGSTGYPKPALLSHRSITCQNMCLGAAFGIDEDNARMLVNLPPSHVGCQTEQLMTVMFGGGTAVILHIFDPAKSLKAIQDYKINSFGQIPALFALQWRLPDYDQFDLSSLSFALYGGQQVSRQFLERLSQMAPGFGTGLGLTETAGFCTYSPLDGTVDDILAGVGFDMPVYPLSIRKEMRSDGSAGDELPQGEVGNICFTGPQTFLTYVNNPEATAKTISNDGFLYTGDLGFVDDKGLHFAGRAKHVIKPKGYQVFPAQIEDHFCELREKVAAAGAVGVEHEVFSEGIVCFVEKQPDVELTEADLHEHARGMASYMRPLHYVIVEHGQFPLNRVAKTDYLLIKAQAEKEVEQLRSKGKWDKE